jgi:hypothetical protein
MSSEMDALRQRAQQWLDEWADMQPHEAPRHRDGYGIIRDLAALEAQQGMPVLVEAFRFTSFQDWVNTAHAKPWTEFNGHSTEVCADAKGRICRSGAEFMRARDESTFPVIAYRVEQPQ